MDFSVFVKCKLLSKFSSMFFKSLGDMCGQSVNVIKKSLKQTVF